MPDIKFSNQYPYTDFHELNLDWVIKEVKYWSTKVGKTIQSIELTGTAGLVDTYTINYSDGTTSTFDVTNGNGIASVAKTGTAGLVDTYTITFQDGSTTTFEVTNGAAAVDPTLTLSDYAADAKVTGDAINDIKQNLPSIIYDALTPVSTVANYRACYTSSSGGKAYLTASSGQNAYAFPVKAGDNLLVRSFGYDRESFEVAVVGEELVGAGQSTPIVQIINCGGSTYPTDYTNHTLFITIAGDGYLYINDKTSTGVSVFAATERKTAIRNGLIKDGTTYYHFAFNADNKYIVRRFNRRGPNNLFQMTSAGIGTIVNGVGYVETEELTGDITTDILGPFSMKKYGTAGGGVWAGGNHSVNVGGTPCPTAEQLSLSVTMNGETVVNDGIYFGNIKITAQNKIYYAQSITGNTFVGAEAALLETREYILTDTMTVNVSVELLEKTYFSVYHGMQYINRNTDSVVFPADETVYTVPLTGDYVSPNKQSDIILRYSSGTRLHMIMHAVGLGTYNRNDGSYAAVGYGSIGSGKTYYTIIADETIDSGAQLFWSGEYRQIV